MIYAVLCAPKTERVLLFMKSYINYFDNCVYSFESKKSVISGEKLGITSTIASVMTGDKSVCDLHTINACPYTATDMSFDVRLDGEKIKVDRWRWLPTAILREGECDGFTAKTLATLIHNGRGAVLKVELLNKTEKEKRIPLAVMYRGVAKYLDNWNFCIPDPEKSLLEYYSEHDGVIGSSHNGISFLMTSSLSGMKYFHTAYLWENELTLPVGEPLTFYFSLPIGPDAECLAEAKATEADYEGAIERSFDYLIGEVDRIHNALPNFSSDDPELDAYYYRCLVTYILCRWDNPALCVVPYFSTGSMSGSCMCSYLWDWCGGLMMHSIYDAEVNRRQLRALLKNDLTKSYALNPITAGPTGPWYPVNQEKITLMVYHHVRATGDKEFLFEKINGKTVIDHMREQAYVCDDLSKPVTLYDYGKGKLEPRRPVWSGMYCNDLAGPWNVVMLSEHVDGQTTHPYPLFTPFCSMERLTDMRSALHSAAHTALFADTTEQPTLVEEIGTLGATVISDDYSPEYYEKSFWSSLQHGGTGFLWWCAFDQESFDFPPYDGAAVEQTLGLAYSDGTPKKIMKKMGEMAEAARALPSLSAKISDATVILTDPENAWKHTYGAFCLASQAGGAVDFMDRSRPLRKSKNYIIPSVEKDCALKFIGELICAVEGGARLLLTYGGGHLAPFERLTGLRVRGRETANKTFKAELFGKEISIKAEKSLSLHKGEAEVILSSGEDILLTKHKLGLGEVWFLNAPIEAAYTTTYSPEKTNLHLIYKLFLGDEKPLSLDTSLASLTYHTQKDKKTIFVLITRFDEKDEIPFNLTKGYAIKSTKYCYIDNNTIHFDKFYAVVELEKIFEI